MTIDVNNFLDFSNLYFNEIIGDVWLGILVGLLLVVIASIRFKMPYQLTILFSLFWVNIVFAMFTGLLILWTFSVLIAGVLFYYAASKVLQR